MKRYQIVLIVIGVILAIIAGLVWWQFDNIKSIYYSYKYNNEEIEQLIQKHYDEIDKYIQQNDNLNVRPSTEVEQKLHQSELLTDEELVNVLVGKNEVSDIFGVEVQLDSSDSFVTPTGEVLTEEALKEAKIENVESVPVQTESTANSNDVASQCVAKMYVLKSTFESKLDGLYNEAIAYYNTMSSEQKKNAKSEIMKKFYSRATELEASCDSQVSAILAELEIALDQSGESKELISKIQTAYSEEKSLKKAYYLNLHK